VRIKNVKKHTTSAQVAFHHRLPAFMFFDKVRVDCYFLFLFSHLACHDAWSTGVVLVVFSSRLVSCFFVLPMLICCFVFLQSSED